jgi:hypothetical protein
MQCELLLLESSPSILLLHSFIASLKLGQSTFFNAGNPTGGMVIWPWSPCDPTAPILTKMRVWTSLPGSSAVIESWSGEFSLYLGTGVRGFAVTVANAGSGTTPTNLLAGNSYKLSIGIANPSPPSLPFANVQAPPSTVTVLALRNGRMFGGAKNLATLVTSSPVTYVDANTVSIIVTLPKSLAVDWVDQHVSFQVSKRLWARGVSLGRAFKYLPHHPARPMSTPITGYRCIARFHDLWR